MGGGFGIQEAYREYKRQHSTSDASSPNHSKPYFVEDPGFQAGLGFGKLAGNTSSSTQLPKPPLQTLLVEDPRSSYGLINKGHNAGLNNQRTSNKVHYANFCTTRESLTSDWPDR